MWFRSVMGVGSVLFLLSAVFLCTRPMVGRDINLVDVAVAGFSLFVAFTAGQIALTGKPPKAGKEPSARRQKLISAAYRYAAGEMSLEEYGTTTRELLEGGREWQQLALAGKKLEACKRYREEMGVSLMEAKRAIGRPRKFETPDDLRKAIQEYFDSTPINEYTVTGLALAIGTSRVVIDEYMKREGYEDIVREAKAIVENSYELSMRKTGRSGDIFALKNFGWKDKQEITHDVPDDLRAELSKLFPTEKL